VDAVAVIASALLGVVFLASGAAKIAARDGWPAQAREMGAPTAVVPVLPWVEIVLGAVLVSQIAARLAGLVSVLLLLAFTALIVVRLREGRRPPCACFGAWSAKPLGWGHVVRNALLLGLAVLVVLTG
jgi:uncharacterized membrane protein YphA (DoxX/SURF4 family)